MKRVLSVFMAMVITIMPTGILMASAAQSGGYTYTVAGSEATITKYTGAGGAITIPSKIGTYNVTSIGEDAFEGCTGLTSVTIGTGVTSIGDGAFYDCTGLTSVTIPNSVTSIGAGAFDGCTGLTSVTIPNSVTSIGFIFLAFSGCTGLTQFIVDGSNPSYSSQDGVLFNKEKTAIIQFPLGKTGTYIIPDSVTSIGFGAFEGCTGLKSITIPNSVISIEDGAFKDCTGLTSVTIPNSVTSIGDYALLGCTRLTQFIVDGSNPSYSSQDGVLFNKAKTTLIRKREINGCL